MAPDIESRRRAMDTFERTTYDRFYWYVYRHLGNEVESIDVLQNVYLGIWEKPERLRNVASWGQLLGTVYYYYARGLFRSVYRDKKRRSPLLDKTLESLLPNEPSVIEKIEQKELCELVRQKLKKLSALDRKCIKLWMKGASYRQISIEVKTNVGAVKMRISRAFLKLRRMFDDDNPKDRKKIKIQN